MKMILVFFLSGFWISNIDGCNKNGNNIDENYQKKEEKLFSCVENELNNQLKKDNNTIENIPSSQFTDNKESIKYYKSVIFSDNGMYVMHAKDNNKFNFLKVLQLNMINKYQVYQIFKYENSGSFVLVHSSKDINYNDLENKCSSNNNAGESMPKKTVNMLNKTKKIVIKDNNHNVLNTIEMALKYALNNGYISPKNLENL